jgi:glycine cleavage system H protein
MEEFPADLKYTKEHEWARVEGDGKVRMGITWYAQDSLGDVLFVKLPDVGKHVSAGEAFAEVESSKAVSDVYAPVSGTVTEVNESLVEEPERINQDPYGAGWIALIDPDDPQELESLMAAEDYRSFVEAEG